MINKKKVIFVVPTASSHRTAEENLGIGYLASILKNNDYNVDIIDGWLGKIQNDEIIKKILINDNILFIGFSMYRSNIENMRIIIKGIRKKLSCPIIAGGFGPSFFPLDFLNNGVDIISYGESEKTILNLSENFKTGKPELSKIKGIIYKVENRVIRNKPEILISDLDSIPFPSRDTVDLVIKRKSSVNILSSRGCNGYCLFCSIIAFQKLSIGHTWRQRSIENFVAELKYLYHSKGVNLFKIIDDSFIEYPRDIEWCKELYSEIKKHKLKIRIRGSIKAECVNEKTLLILKKIGFFSFACGIENFSNTVLRRLGKKATKNDNINALNIFKKYKIYVQCGFILFDPYTTMNELKENYKYLKKYNWVLSKGVFTELYAAKGTVFTEKFLKNKNDLYMKNENYVYKIYCEDVRKVYTALKHWFKNYKQIYDKLIDPLTAPKNISKNEMKQIYKIYLLVREKDLIFFKNTLQVVYKKDFDEIIKFTNEQIKIHTQFFNKIIDRINHLYNLFGLEYDGEINKYII